MTSSGKNFGIVLVMILFAVMVMMGTMVPVVDCVVTTTTTMSRYQAIRELGLVHQTSSHGITPEELKKAYRKRCMETHPDKGGSHEEFIRVSEAYEILSSSCGGAGRGTGDERNSYHRSQQKHDDPNQDHQNHFHESILNPQEIFEKAEDMFFDVFEEYFQDKDSKNGKRGDSIFLDKLFGPTDQMSRTKQIAKSSFQWLANHVTTKVIPDIINENKEYSIAMNGHRVHLRPSDVLAWHERVLQRRKHQNKM